jgi:Zinc dependent phospholipase C
MPGSTTHSYILYSALRRLEGQNDSLFAPVVKSHVTAIAHAMAGDASALAESEDGVLQGCAYMGSCGPDLFYLELGSTGSFLADLLHYNRSGYFPIRWLADLRSRATQLKRAVDEPMQQLAYVMGHISHIAADIVLHPYVNSIVGAYPDNGKNFFEARATVGPRWKFHNKLEHYQDAYVLHQHFIDDAKFCKGMHLGDLNCVNLALPAALRMYKAPASKFMQQGVQAAGSAWRKWRTGSDSLRKISPLGLMAQTQAFYGYANDLSAIENEKYGFFADTNFSGNYMLNVSHYYAATIPDEATMKVNLHLVQPKLLDAYVAKAVAVTLEMWQEVHDFITGPGKNVNPDHPAGGPGQLGRLSAKELAAFKTLGRHWNLDTGLAPALSRAGRAGPVPDVPHTQLHVPGGLKFESIHDSAMPDVVPFATAEKQRLPKAG